MRRPATCDEGRWAAGVALAEEGAAEDALGGATRAFHIGNKPLALSCFDLFAARQAARGTSVP
jgi:hypothetical protein